MNEHMDLNSIDQFVVKHNEYLSNKVKTFGEVTLIQKNLEYHQTAEESLDYFLKEFIYPWDLNMYAFVFLRDGDIARQEELLASRGLIYFADHANYNLEYVYDKSDGSVGLNDPECEEIEWDCAPSIRNFFLIMVIKIETEIKKQELGTFELDNTYLLEKYYQCMELNGNQSRYSQFIEHLLGVRL